MKNFKKVLALVLVVATLLSFATVASAATSASYTDADKVTRTAAVDVLSYIGVLNGYSDKTFRPQGEITRAEAAKIIAMFDNGDATINGLYASANPFTDCVGHWAESSIAYCYKMGIIDGVGNLKFDPESNVTGVQFLKMALIVLGYNAQKEGLTGASWAVNTLALAKKAGLLSQLGNSYDYAANLVREDAAQIMLNALNSNIVDYGYEVKNAWAGTMNTAQYITAAGAVVVKDKYLKDTWNINITTYTDAFERPGYKYYNTKTGALIGAYLLTPEVTYTTKISECKLLEDLGIPKTNVKDSVTIDPYLNGLQYADDELIHDSKNECLAAALANTHQGTLTEVYDVSTWTGKNADGTANADYRVVSIDTWLANVTDVSKTTDNRVGHRDGNTPLLTLVNYIPETYDYQNHNVANSCTGANTQSEMTYAAEGFAKNDKVLITYSHKKDSKGNTLGVQSVELAKTESAKLTGFDHTADCDYRTVNVGGTDKGEAYKFEYGYNLLAKDYVKYTFTFYYDAYGNVIGIDTGAAADATYAVIDSAYYTIDNGFGTVKASIVGLDAAASDVEAYSAYRWTSQAEGPFSYTEFSRYSYTAAASRDYNVDWTGNEWAYDILFNTTVADVYGRLAFTPADGTVYRSKVDLAVYEPTDVVVVNEGDKNVHVNYDENTKEYEFEYPTTSATQFLIHENDGTYTSATQATVGTIQAYGVQIVDEDNDGYADVVYLFGGIIRKSDVSYGYVADWTAPQYKVVGTTTYCVYNAYFNGVRTPVYCTTEMGGYLPGYYKFSFTLGDDGILWTTPAQVKSVNDAVSFASVNADNDAVKINSIEAALNLASGVKVYWVNGTTNAGTNYGLVVEVGLDYLVANDDIVYITNAAGLVTEIYIVTNDGYPAE